jgi:hypothetical protein
MNNGKAVNVHELELVQMVVIIASPAGRIVNISMPTHATPIRARPIQMDDPRRVNRTKRKTIVAYASVIRLSPI